MKGIDVFESVFRRSEVKYISKGSLRLLDEILDLLSQIDGPKDEMRHLWLTAEREPFAEYMQREDRYEQIKTEEDYVEEYPYQTIWIPVSGMRYKKERYLSVYNLWFQIEQETTSRTERDFSEILTWVKEGVQNAINELKAGTYNEKVRRELPYTLRDGTIRRSDYWAVHPKDKERELEGLTAEEITAFIESAEKYKNEPTEVIPKMTFAKYFELAKICYKRIGYDMRQSDRETFFAHAEDFGSRLFEGEGEYDSPKYFDDFYEGIIAHMGGHPWGIIRGSSRSRIGLFPIKKEEGYCVRLTGNPNWNVSQLVLCFLALKEAKIPFCLSFTKDVIRYLKEEDDIGLVTELEMPIYCQLRFPDQRINDFRHYNPKIDAAIFDKISWLPIEEVKLRKVEE